MDEKPKRPPRKRPAAKRPAHKAADSAEPAPAASETPEGPAAEPPAAGAPPDTAVAGGETTAAEEPTAALPAAEQPTTVSPSPVEPTEVMPPVAAPAGYAPLSRQAVVAPPGESRRTLWIVVAVAVAAIAAVALFWVLALGPNAEPFLGTWSRSAEVGGGLLVQQNGDEVTVRWFDGQLNEQGPLPATIDGDVLSFQIPDVGGSGPVEATLTTTSKAGTLQLSLNGTTELVTASAALAPAAGTSSPSPVPSSTPSATPSPTLSLSPSPSPSSSSSLSPSPSPSATGTDQDVVDAILVLQSGVLQYAAAHGNVFPAATDVTETGAVGQSMESWPANPFTGQPMQTGTAPGDYTYEQLMDGKSYRLTGYRSNAQTFTVP